MKLITRSVAALAVTALSVGSATAIADSDDRSSRQAVDTRADYTPFEEFEPLPTSSACQGEGSGRQAQPFVTPPGYLQQVVSEESDQLADSPPGPPGMEDLFDMLTQNEFGKQAGRFLYRTHEVGPAASGAAPRDSGGPRSLLLTFAPALRERSPSATTGSASTASCGRHGGRSSRPKR
jgi:hypothetical protein